MSGNVIVSGLIDRILKVWNVDIGYCMYILYGYLFIVRCMDMYDSIVVSGFRDGILRVWDILFGNCFYVLVGYFVVVRW